MLLKKGQHRRQVCRISVGQCTMYNMYVWIITSYSSVREPLLIFCKIALITRESLFGFPL